MTARPADSIPPDYFEQKYTEKLDYWDFATSAYEAAKYAHTLAVLPQPIYRSGFEIGCSIGVLTALLVPRCTRLLAIDVAEKALAAAKVRAPQARFAQMRFPLEAPRGERFDLIVVSEVAYYWSASELGQAQQRILDLLEPGGHLILVHWTGGETDYPLLGAEVHRSFKELAHLQHRHGEAREKYVLDLFCRDAAL